MEEVEEEFQCLESPQGAGVATYCTSRLGSRKERIKANKRDHWTVDDRATIHTRHRSNCTQKSHHDMYMHNIISILK